MGQHSLRWVLVQTGGLTGGKRERTKRLEEIVCRPRAARGWGNPADRDGQPIVHPTLARGVEHAGSGGRLKGRRFYCEVGDKPKEQV